MKNASQEGEKITAIAKAAGVGRQTIYRWINDDLVTKRIRVDVTMEKALAILAGYGHAASARYLGGKGTPIGRMAALKTGITELLPKVDEEERLILQEAAFAAAEAERLYHQNGSYPNVVSSAALERSPRGFYAAIEHDPDPDQEPIQDETDE